jgi:hypothetical protein
VRVDEPGREREADVGDAVEGLESGPVVFLELDAAGAQVGRLRGKVKVRKSSLSIITSRPIPSP